MKTKMQDTSLEAYQNIKELKTKESIVLEAIKMLGICCDADIARYLGWSINRITGRRNSLEKKGKIILAKKDVNPVTHTRVAYWEYNKLEIFSYTIDPKKVKKIVLKPNVSYPLFNLMALEPRKVNYGNII